MKLFFCETEPKILTERGESVLQYLNYKRQKDDIHSPHTIFSKRFLVSKQQWRTQEFFRGGFNKFS